MSADTTMSGCVARICSSFSVPMPPEILGNATENVPPKPRHCSPSPTGTTVSPAIDRSSVSAASLLLVPRLWQERWNAARASYRPGQC